VSTLTTTETKQVESTDLRADTLGQFHPVTVKRVLTTDTPFVTSDDASNPDRIQDAEAVCIVIQHPNGDEEILYEYASSVIRYGNGEICEVKSGDTIWIAEWEDIYKPVITPGERDYVICLSASEAEAVEPQKHPESQLINKFFLACLTLPIASIFVGSEVSSVTGIPPLIAIGLLTGVSVGGALYTIDMDCEEIYSQHIPVLSTESTEFTVVRTGSGTVLEDIVEHSQQFHTFSPVRVTDANVETGVITVTNNELSRPIKLQFTSPRKWDREYELIDLVETVGVGSVEQLVGESLHIRYGDHHTVNPDNAFKTMDCTFYIKTDN